MFQSELLKRDFIHLFDSLKTLKNRIDISRPAAQCGSKWMERFSGLFILNTESSSTCAANDDNFIGNERCSSGHMPRPSGLGGGLGAVFKNMSASYLRFPLYLWSTVNQSWKIKSFIYYTVPTKIARKLYFTSCWSFITAYTQFSPSLVLGHTLDLVLSYGLPVYNVEIRNSYHRSWCHCVQCISVCSALRTSSCHSRCLNSYPASALFASSYLYSHLRC